MGVSGEAGGARGLGPGEVAAPWVRVLGWSWSVGARGQGDLMVATQSEDPPLDRLLPCGVPRGLVDCILSLCVCWVGS